MTRLLVDVHLEVLVVVEEAPPDLVDGEVEGVLLIQQVGVVLVGQRGLHLNHLPGHLFPDGVDVGPLAHPAPLPQPALHGPAGCLEVVVQNLKVPEAGEEGVLGQGGVHHELHLPSVHLETIAHIYPHLDGHTADQTVDLCLKIAANKRRHKKENFHKL